MVRKGAVSTVISQPIAYVIALNRTSRCRACQAEPGTAAHVVALGKCWKVNTAEAPKRT